MIRNSRSLPFPRSLRGGATLTEVLMAILIMSIGIVSVCALFPISIVSSIRATQLTNGKILRENVNELVHCVPELLDPPLAGLNWRGEWQPNTRYDEGHYVIPRRTPGSLVPSPYFALRRQVEGFSGSTEPEWSSMVLYHSETDPLPVVVDPNEIRWEMIDIPNYVIDPYGYFRSSVTDPSRFGDLTGQVSSSNSVNMLPLRTPSAAALDLENEPTQEDRALSFFTAPDSWSVLVEDLPTSINGTSISFPSSVDFTGISTDPRFCRVVLSTPDGTQSLIRFPTSGSMGSTLTVSQPVPAGFLGPARVETFSPRYTYFLTVRNNGRDVSPTISCAVVFNRQLSPGAEHAYMANFGNPEFTAVAAVADPLLQTDQVRIAWDNGEPEPYLKVGAYLLDVRALVFYRITAVNKSGNRATVTLNRPVESITRNNSSNLTDLAIMMPGIIHVYYVPLTLHSNQ